MNKTSKEGANRIVIGKITRPHGVKGAFKVFPLTDDPERFSRIDAAYLVTPEGRPFSCRIASVQHQKRMLILRCSEMNRVEEIESFIGGTVEIPSEEAVTLPPNTFFQHDLLGLDVSLEDGTRLGRVQEIWPTGANDVLVVRDTQKEYLIPALRAVIIEVHIATGRMVIRPPEGLLDLSRER